MMTTTRAVHYQFRKGDTAGVISLDVPGGLDETIATAAVLFAARNSSNEAILDDGAATVTNVLPCLDGSYRATFRFVTNSTATGSAGTFYGQFKVVYSDGSIQSFPGDESLTYDVVADYTTLDEADAAAGVTGFLQTQALHGFAVKDLVYYGASGWAKALADSALTLAAGIVLAVPDTSTFRVAYFTGQEVTLAAHGLGSAGSALYLSEVTAGLATTSAPTTGFVQRIGIVKDANTLILWPHAAEPAA